VRAGVGVVLDLESLHVPLLFDLEPLPCSPLMPCRRGGRELGSDWLDALPILLVELGGA
jgi:hypothetical protein